VAKSIKISEARKLAALQCTHVEAAAFFGMSTTKWRKCLDSDKRLKAAWEEGKQSGKINLRRKQFRLANTNAQMAIHLGKQVLEQTDSKSIELSGPNGGPMEMDLTKLSSSERKQLRHLLTQSATNSEATR
jgi:hypothetical protein